MSIWTDREGRKHVGVMVEGQRIHRRMPKGSTTSEAKRLESEIRATHSRRVTIPGDPLLAEIMGMYLEHAKTLRSPETAKYHALRAGPWIERRRVSEAELVAAEMAADMASSYAPATINRTLGAITKALTLAWKMRLTPENYGARIERLPENNLRTNSLTIDQVASIASFCSEQVQAAIWISLFTGCRRGELLSLTPADIGREEIVVRSETTKTLKTRRIPIVAPLRPWLKFVPLKINFEGVKSGFRRARERAGFGEYTFHDLRRSCGTLMIQAGVDVFVVSKILGHSSVKITQDRYAHLQTARMAEGLRRTFG